MPGPTEARKGELKGFTLAMKERVTKALTRALAEIDTASGTQLAYLETALRQLRSAATAIENVLPNATESPGE